MDQGHTILYDRGPARLTAPTIAVWSAYGPLLCAARPLATAQQWVTQGEAAVEMPQAMRFAAKEDTHD